MKIIKSKRQNRIADICHRKPAIIKYNTVKQNGQYLLSQTSHNNRYDFNTPTTDGSRGMPFLANNEKLFSLKSKW